MYRTTYTCVADDCRCDDSHGVVVYEGDDREDAEAALRQCPDRDDYESCVETVDR